MASIRFSAISSASNTGSVGAFTTITVSLPQVGPTPEGMAQLNLAAGTPNGKLLRLRGKGVPDLRGGPQGDLLARIVLEVPQRLTGRQRSAMEELAKSFDASNFPDAKALGDKVKVFYSHKDKLQGTK